MDWNNDGLDDIISGDMLGYITVFLNTGTSLDSGTKIKAGGKDIRVSGRSVPEINDWNEDGKKDLLIGTVKGKVRIYINEGTDGDPAFNSWTYLQAGGNDYLVDTRAAPRVADWNMDGLKDLLIGDISGNLYLLENSGTNEAPVFRDYRRFELADGTPLNYDFYSRPFIVDWDNDGYNDILVGGESGNVMLFLSSPL